MIPNLQNPKNPLPYDPITVAEDHRSRRGLIQLLITTKQCPVLWAALS